MPYPTRIEAIDTAFLSGILGQPVASVTSEPLGDPYTSQVWALSAVQVDGSVRQLVAKLPKRGWTNVRLYQQELHFYRALAGRLGGRVPRPLFAEMSSEADFLLILERAPGTHVREGLDAAQARMALQALAEVHGACWQSAEVRDGLRERRYSATEAGDLAEAVGTRWEAVGRRFPVHLEPAPTLDGLVSEVAALVPITLTNNDLHAENVLISAAGAVFLDWQNATWSSPLVDVANLLGGCVRPEVQRAHWRELLSGYQAALIRAGGEAIPDLEARYATAMALLFAWVLRYLADVSDEEARTRSLLRVHWERVCTGVALARGWPLSETVPHGVEMRIETEEIEDQGAFRAFDGDASLGSMVWRRGGPTTIYVLHLGVEEAARGQGVGLALFEHLVAWARQTGTRVMVQCPYTQSLFRKHPEARDVLR